MPVRTRSQAADGTSDTEDPASDEDAAVTPVRTSSTHGFGAEGFEDEDDEVALLEGVSQ